MKFDIVIGNPPYSNGIDLDFVNLGFDLCSEYCIMITPAKWQTTDDNQRVASKTIDYRQFRKKLASHIRKVVFYPDCKDVFDIFQIDGVCYYLIDKNNTYEYCEVVNISKTRGNIYNSTVKRSIKNRESLLNIGNEIINSLEPYKKFEFSVINNNKRFVVMTNTQISGYDWHIDTQPRYVLGISRILDTHAGESYDGTARIVIESEDRSECESFVSWLNTKFTRFFIVPNLSKVSSALTDYYFRFVPAPPSGKFDHIYTDEELYKAFNLPQKYIDVIEAVIKARK